MVAFSACTCGVACACGLQLSFPVFVMALMSFVGWILFVFFGGLGLVGIPIDSIRVSAKVERGRVQSGGWRL